jgi:hypothetical protein
MRAVEGCGPLGRVVLGRGGDVLMLSFPKTHTVRFGARFHRRTFRSQPFVVVM